MDGTLTHAIHDFDAIREQLGLPPGKPILEAIEQLAAAPAERIRQQLDELEMNIAAQATPQPGAEALLDKLQSEGRQLGILTRNGKDIAHATLSACGLAHYFTDDDVVSRDCCTPKPDPAGVSHLMRRWQAKPDSTVMVGDYLFDLQAGYGAGTHTVHLAVDGHFRWPDKTSCGVSSLVELQQFL